MVTFECENKECANYKTKFDFIGKEEFAECGSCKANLKSKNFRKDPEPIIILMGSANE
jgi:hypothetical protein